MWPHSVKCPIWQTIFVLKFRVCDLQKVKHIWSFDQMSFDQTICVWNSNIPSSANAEEYIFCCMVQNIRNNWVIAANQAQTDERRRPSQSRSESRSPLAVPANPKEHAPCPCFVPHVQKRHSAHIIHILYNGVPADEWLQRCARQHNIHHSCW